MRERERSGETKTGKYYYNKCVMNEKGRIESNEVTWEKPLKPPAAKETLEEYEERLTEEDAELLVDLVVRHSQAAAGAASQ